MNELLDYIMHAVARWHVCRLFGYIAVILDSVRIFVEEMWFAEVSEFERKCRGIFDEEKFVCANVNLNYL